MKASGNTVSPPSTPKSTQETREKQQHAVVERGFSELMNFSSLAFQAAQDENKALALTSYLSAQRFLDGNDCTDHVHWDAMRTLTGSDAGTREGTVSIAAEAAKIPLDFQINATGSSQSMYEEVLARSEEMSGLAKLSATVKEWKLSKVLNPTSAPPKSEVGSTSHLQVIDLTQNCSPQDRPFRKRRHLHHTSLVKQEVNDPSAKPSQTLPAPNDDKMDVETAAENGDNGLSSGSQDPLRSLGFQTAGDQLRSKGYKKFAAGRGNAPGPSGVSGGRAPRMGLTKRATDTDNLRGGFVPPFVKKAIEGPGEKEQESSFSPKTLELLVGPDGELPEELQKMDPALIETICSEVMHSGGGVEWDDIAGQEAAKQLVQELVVWPMLNPHIFKGARAPPKGFLLFGPPGTGKTLLGRAIASNIKATFFSISASSLTSKWIGEGEKLVRTLFAVSECVQPSVIFIDEIDSILSARKAEGEHEASRRLKTELLVQMEGCNTNSVDRRVLVVGATNRPEELDEAARRRMPKQLYIPLPCAAAREQMIQRQLSGVKYSLSSSEQKKVVEKTEGYSGSDMKNLVQEACQGPVRDAIQHTRHKRSSGPNEQNGISGLSDSDLRPVVIKDFQVAARAQKPSVGPEEVARHEAYNAKHGAKYAAQADDTLEEDW